MNRTLFGKTAFVSGSGKNIGRGIAIHLAKMGANVVINGSSDEVACNETAKMVAQEGSDALVVMGDMGQAQAMEDMAQSALKRFGAIDILVHNAARRPHKPFLQMTDDDWHEVINVSLFGAYQSARVFLPGMVDKGWGRIINFAGMKAIRGYFEGAPISAAKHGVWGLTKAISTEFAHQGITANIVSPGQIRKDASESDDPSRVATIPVGFMGRSSDIAAVVGFLSSPEARFVTGQMIAVNGGEET